MRGAYDRGRLVELFGDDASTVAEIEREFLEGTCIVHVVPRRQQNDRQADRGRPLAALRQYRGRAPVDVLEQARMRSLQPDGVVAAVARRAEYHTVAGLAQRRDRLL